MSITMCIATVSVDLGEHSELGCPALPDDAPASPPDAPPLFGIPPLPEVAPVPPPPAPPLAAAEPPDP
jgi:hypothetical protein